jgi:hypothetical protein
METEVFDIALHLHPQDLQKTLQKTIDASDGIYDPIYLGYGLCSKAVVGLVAKKSRLIIPRSDDCVEIFLGSREERKHQLEVEPGTIFLTPGYIGDESLGMNYGDHERNVARYGEEKAKKLRRIMLKHYKRLVYIRMPHATTLESDRVIAKNAAAEFDWRYEEIEGKTEWLERMMQPELNEDFVVVEPGQALELAHFVNL